MTISCPTFCLLFANRNAIASRALSSVYSRCPKILVSRLRKSPGGAKLKSPKAEYAKKEKMQVRKAM